MRRLPQILEHQVQESDTTKFEVGDQIERNYRYYSLQPIGNEITGRSQYISPDVMDGVESKKALFRQTFLSNRQTIKFICSSYAPPGEADAKTAYVEMALKRNKRERLFSDCWHDAFLAKRCVMLAEWKEDTEPVQMIIPQPMEQEQIFQIIGQSVENVVDVDMSQMEMVQAPGMAGPVTLFAGPVTAYKDDSHVKYTLVQPERYFRDPLVADVEDAMWAGYSDDVPRGTLVKMGYDEDQINGLQEDYRWRSDDVDFARKAHDQSHSAQRRFTRAGDQETVTVWKTWTWLNLAEAGAEFGDFPDELRLYEIHWAAGEILRWAPQSEDAEDNYAIREADEIPFFEWSEMRISHAEFGLCDADVTAHTQKAQSALKRLILDNQQMRNTSRYEAIEGAIKNPRDLLDNRIGGVIWSEAIGSVAPLATPELSPLTMGAIQLLADDQEKRSGLSRLGKGMNMDAVTNQNSADMIERLTNAGTIRPIQAARDWASTFLIPLAQYTIRLAMRNDQSVTQTEVSGQMVQIAPQTWQDNELLMEVAVALTPQEAQEHAQKLLMMHQLMAQDPVMEPLYGVQQRHAMFDDIFDALGVADTTKYMMRPDSPEYMQMMQQRQQEAAAQQQAQQDAMMAQMEIMGDEQARKWAEANSKIMDTIADNEREDEKFEWSKYVDQKEINIEEEQKRAASI